MKKLIQSFVLIALLIGYAMPAMAQASTEGKEFWVALLMANSPSGFSEGSFEPFIAISSKKACQVTVSNPAQNWSQPTRSVAADSWLVINDIPVDKWYDKNWSANSASEVVSQLGIKVTATEDVSVYAAIRMEFSYDASNILPVTALGSEYIIQDYPPYNSEGESHAVFTVLATEDNTTVRITPTVITQKNKPAGTAFEVNLSKGQTYQVIGKDKNSFSGTRVEAYATDNRAVPKNIAVFQGADFTQVPGGKSARDCLYEQAMPLDYWGTEFVVTRSQEKDANRVRITAQIDGTTLSIDGIEISQVLNAGDTYEFEMSENLASTDMASAIAKAGRSVPPVLTGEAHYIETSCPVAVYEYDVSSDYRFSSTTKIGDPSMVWISPLQQRILKITFGACGTTGAEGHTNRHFVNIVCLTTDTATVKLNSEIRSNIPVIFTPVPGNNTYSYARVFLVDTDGSNVDKVYTLTSKQGVVAHVYGSGMNESYAYSVGSAAVKQGINVNDVTFVDGFISPDKFCIEDVFEFDANIGTDEVTRVDWNFGDGTMEYNGSAQTNHKYLVPGWYDVHADLYGHQVCTDGDELPLGSVQFSFKIVIPDTIYKPIEHHCIDKDSILDGRKLSADSVAYYLTYGSSDTSQIDCASNVYITPITYGMETVEVQDTIEGYDYVLAPNGRTYYSSQEVVDTIKPYSDLECIRYIQYYVKVITCLDMDVIDDLSSQHLCPGENLTLTYIKRKGNIDGDAQFKVPGKIDTTFTISDEDTPNGRMVLPTGSIKTPGFYSGQIIVNDLYCGEKFGPKVFQINFAVNYPDSIFCFKFNNVLAVYKNGHGYNTGYDFEHYEWHLVRNGNDQVVGGDESVLYLGQNVPFENGDSVYVVLTDVRGVTLPSCPQWLLEIPDYNLEEEEPSKAPARKMIINGQFIIRREEADYDIYGQRVK